MMKRDFSRRGYIKGRYIDIFLTSMGNQLQSMRQAWPSPWQGLNLGSLNFMTLMLWCDVPSQQIEKKLMPQSIATTKFQALWHET